MKARDIINISEKKFPKINAEEWDNVGLLVGDYDKEVKKIQFSIDASLEVIENAMKEKAMEVPAIKAIIEKMEAEMAGNGRILVRPSGTEPLLRVMAEAPTTEEVNYYVDTIAAVVKDEIGID